MYLFQEIEKLKALQEQVEVTKLHSTRRYTLFLVKSIRCHNNFIKLKASLKMILKGIFPYSQKEPPKVDLFQDTENLTDAQEYGTVNALFRHL